MKRAKRVSTLGRPPDFPFLSKANGKRARWLKYKAPITHFLLAWALVAVRWAFLLLCRIVGTLVSRKRKAEKETEKTKTKTNKQLPPPRRVRHAEKSRTATCSFADDVARMCVDKFNAVRAKISVDHGKDYGRGQTVVACVLEQRPCVLEQRPRLVVSNTE